MKKILIFQLLVLSFIFTSCGDTGTSTSIKTESFAGWELLNMGTNVPFNTVFFLSKDTGWVAGGGGTIMHTTNGGNTWIKQNSGTSHGIYSIFFLDENHGWAVGGEYVNSLPGNEVYLSTSDGGNTWNKKVISPFNTVFNHIEFTDETFGVLSGNSRQGNLLYLTSDGGKNWLRNDSLPFRSEIQDIYSDGSDNIWVAGSVNIAKSTDAGQNWQPKQLQEQIYVTSIDFIDSFNGWICGWDGSLQKTNDGGNTWFPVFSPQSGSPDLFNISFITVLSGWVVGEQGLVIFTEDAFKQYIQLRGTDQNLYQVFFVDRDNGWIVGNKGIVYRTQTGGF